MLFHDTMEVCHEFFYNLQERHLTLKLCVPSANLGYKPYIKDKMNSIKNSDSEQN